MHDLHLISYPLLFGQLLERLTIDREQNASPQYIRVIPWPMTIENSYPSLLMTVVLSAFSSSLSVLTTTIRRHLSLNCWPFVHFLFSRCPLVNIAAVTLIYLILLIFIINIAVKFIIIIYCFYWLLAQNNILYNSNDIIFYLLIFRFCSFEYATVIL